MKKNLAPTSENVRPEFDAKEWELTPLSPRPAPVAELVTALLGIHTSYLTLAAHSHDFQRINSRHEPYTQIPSTAEEFVATRRAEWEAAGNAWSDERDSLERQYHAFAERDRASWQLIHKEMPKWYQRWRQQLKDTIQMLPRLMDQLRAFSELPGDLCSTANAALRSLELHTVRYTRQPWQFPDQDETLQREMQTIHKIIVLLNNGVFPEQTRASLKTPQPSPPFVFKREGANWRVTAYGITGTFPDRRGFQFIAQTLAFPNPTQPLHAMVLEGKPVPTAAEAVTHEQVMDPEYQDQTRAEVQRLKGQIQVAEENNDSDGERDLRTQLETLEGQVRKALRLSGQSRKIGPGSQEERSRINVHARMKEAYQMLEFGKPPQKELAEHLREWIRTEGCQYAYRPPDPTPEWELDSSLS